MQFFFIILIIGFVLFLFRLYHLAVDDYVLIKKNISLEDVFNCAFLVALGALLFSRLFYVIFHPSPVLTSPLGFLLFPYFPGLSLVGGLIGGGLFLFMFSNRARFPLGRIFDFFVIALLFSLPPAFVGYMLLSSQLGQGEWVKLILFLIMFGLTSLYLYPKASSLEIKDGSLSLLFLIFYSLVALLGNSIDSPGAKNFLQNKENFLLLFFLLGGLVVIVRQEILGRINFGK